MRNALSKKVVDDVVKPDNNVSAACRYHTSCMQVKRWKKTRTIFKKPKSYGLDLDSAKRIGFLERNFDDY